MFWKIFIDLCAEKGVSPTSVAKDLGLSSGTTSAWKKGADPRISTKREIAEYFDVPVTYFMEDDSTDVRPVKAKRIRMIGKISCGQPIYADEDFETYVDASNDVRADFCVTAAGDSMIGARIYDGDIVFIKEQSTVDNGDIAAVIIGDTVTLKRWFFYPDKKRLVLSPENSKYEPLVYENNELENIRCIGKAVSFMGKL